MQPEIEEDDEEEDEVTEEDLRRAEEEFLHGPMGNTDLNPEDDTEGTEEAQPLTEEEELERFIRIYPAGKWSRSKGYRYQEKRNLQMMSKD